MIFSNAPSMLCLFLAHTHQSHPSQLQLIQATDIHSYPDSYFVRDFPFQLLYTNHTLHATFFHRNGLSTFPLIPPRSPHPSQSFSSPTPLNYTHIFDLDAQPRCSSTMLLCAKAKTTLPQLNPITGLPLRHAPLRPASGAGRLESSSGGGNHDGHGRGH